MTILPIIVAIGANLPHPDHVSLAKTCAWGVAQVASRTGLKLVACSPWYRSTPVPPSAQPDYVNGVACYAGRVEPVGLLRQLHAIEAEAGRVRGEANAARTLDLDLLAVGGLVWTGELTLPHPRLHERAFVLLPLADVAPEWVHPLLGRTARDMAAEVDRAGVSRLS